jgi:ribosomal-protein-alanine N-acetyltransferase
MASISSEPLYRIRPATWQDLGALRRLERACFPQDAWPLLDLISALSFPNVVRLKAVIAGQMVGFVAGEPKGLGGYAWIATIGVLPDYRGLGIAAALLLACERKLRVARVRLSVRPDNTPAIRLYEKSGYYRVGKWVAYYQDGSDAIVFEKKLGTGL